MISETAQQKSADTTPKISYGRRGKKRQNSQAIIKRRLRVRYAKSGFMRFLSHSDIIRVFELATLSAKIPLVYSQSLRPTPKIAYGSPLMTGIASVAEYLDMEIHIGQEADIQNHLNSYLPEGIEILQYQGIYAKVTALAAVINRATYDILLTGGDIPNTWITDWMATENIPIKRLYKDGPRELNVRPFVSSIEQKEDRLSITIDAHEGRMVKITEVLESLLAPKSLDYRAFFIQRTGQFAIKDNSQYTPLEILP
ncbi:MAG: TIGR03936 family radical SAM-associated protein [Calditrichia bacterium]